MSDWKDKFFKLTEQHEAELERCAEGERLLCRAIVRLTIAVRGLDPNLDPHLVSLQKAAKGGAATPAFQHRLSELSDALVKAREEKPEQNADLLSRLISHVGLQGKALKQVNALYQRLSKQPDKASAEELDQLAQLLIPASPSGAGAEPGRKPGLFNRLLGGNREINSEDGNDNQRPNHQLHSLLQRLDWPARLRSDMDHIQSRLESGSEDSGLWIKTVEEVIDLLSGNLSQVEQDLHDTERFLGALNGRLQELDAVLQRMDIARDQNAASGRALREAMNREVDGVQQDAAQAADMGSFKQQLSKRLDVIKSQVVSHIQQEQERFQAASAETAQMRARMQALEQESERLRRTLAEAQNQASTDALTGLPNRGALEARIAEEVARWQRFGESLCLLVWDIDHFKAINDNFGHQAGDKTLKVVGQLLAGKIRKTDFVARYGGEEFVMLMPGVDLDHAASVANGIRETISKQKFRAGDKLIPITISCGYTEFREGESAETVFKRADDAIYRAKQNGRNRCEPG
jgi:diguanylate cyclase